MLDRLRVHDKLTAIVLPLLLAIAYFYTGYTIGKGGGF